MYNEIKPLDNPLFPVDVPLIFKPSVIVEKSKKPRFNSLSWYVNYDLVYTSKPSPINMRLLV